MLAKPSQQKKAGKESQLNNIDKVKLPKNVLQRKPKKSAKESQQKKVSKRKSAKESQQKNIGQTK